VHLDEVETESLNLSQYSVESRSIEQSREHGVGAVQVRHQRRERREDCGAEVAVVADGVAGVTDLAI
jgi:hypothetical protein